MPIVAPKDSFVSLFAQKKFGRPFGLGRSAFGMSKFADSGVYGWMYGFGIGQMGNAVFGSCDLLTGIYQRRHTGDRVEVAQMEYYWSRNPRSIPQQLNRTKFSDGVSAWALLTAEQKAEYNRKVRPRHGTGRNLFLREYMLAP